MERSNQPPKAEDCLAEVLSPLFPKIVSATTPVGFFAAMSFSAAKRAAQIATPGIAGIREEKNAALPAPHQAFSQVRLGS